jgi:DNA polymerase III epsilon subunit-like protein
MFLAACIVIVLAPCEKSPLSRSANKRPHHAAIVDAAVLEEVLVLGREEGFAHQRRDILVLDRNAAPLTDLLNQLAVARVDPQRYLRWPGTHRGHARQRRI